MAITEFSQNPVKPDGKVASHRTVQKYFIYKSGRETMDHSIIFRLDHHEAIVSWQRETPIEYIAEKQ